MNTQRTINSIILMAVSMVAAIFLIGASASVQAFATQSLTIDVTDVAFQMKLYMWIFGAIAGMYVLARRDNIAEKRTLVEIFTLAICVFACAFSSELTLGFAVISTALIPYGHLTSSK